MKRLLPLIFTLANILTLSIAASAATFTVTKAANSNDGTCDADCSIREAVAAANNGDTVNFSPSLIGQTFTLGGTEIEVFDDITIDGDIDGVNVAQISGGNTSRHFFIHPGADVRFRNMTLVSGNGDGANFSGSGGAIHAESGGTVDIDRLSFRSNSAVESGAIRLNGPGTHRITNSSMTNNTAGNGSALLVTQDGTLYMSNTTISRNDATTPGQGWGAVTVFAGFVTIRNCTISENDAFRGGGMWIGAGGGYSTSIGNSIVAGNTASVEGPDIRYSANLTSAGGNLVSDDATIPGGV